MGGQGGMVPSIGQFPTNGGAGYNPILAYLMGGRPFMSPGEYKPQGAEFFRPDYQGNRQPTPMQSPGRPQTIMDVVRGMQGSQMGLMNAPYAFLSQPGRGYNWQSALPQPSGMQMPQMQPQGRG